MSRSARGATEMPCSEAAEAAADTEAAVAPADEEADEEEEEEEEDEDEEDDAMVRPAAVGLEWPLKSYAALSGARSEARPTEGDWSYWGT